jgi:hypothetical protein
VQEKAPPSVSGLPRTTCQEQCTEAGLETLEERRQLQDWVQIFKIMKEKIQSKSKPFRQQNGTSAQNKTSRRPMELIQEKTQV